MGCKDFTQEEEDIFKLDLIETYWDVKNYNANCDNTLEWDLIETYWDVKSATAVNVSASCLI